MQQPVFAAVRSRWPSPVDDPFCGVGGSSLGAEHPDRRGRHRHNGYRHDLDAAGHEQLVARVSELQASVLVPGYQHPLYDRALEAAGFERHEFAHHCTAARARTGRGARVEVLWRCLRSGAAECLPLSHAGG